MKDINLFSNQVNKKKDTLKRKSGRRMFIFIGFLLGLAFIASWGYMQINIMADAKEIKNYQIKIEDAGTVAKAAEYVALKKEADSIASYGTVLSEINKAFVLADTITTERLKAIADAIPKDMNMTNMTMVKDIITISGECEINDSVAEFEHNLKQLYFMESVFVSNVLSSDEENAYSFSMVCSIRGGVE